MNKIVPFLVVSLFPFWLSAQPSIRYYNRGVRMAKRGDYQRSKLLFSKAIRENWFFTEAYYNRALAESKLSDYSSAIADYSKAIELRPHYAIAYNNRGADKNELKDFTGAIEDYT